MKRTRHSAEQIVKLFLRTDNTGRVRFLVDRLELEEEFSKFVADRKPEEAEAIPAIKTYFEAHSTSDASRHIIESVRLTDLATNPVFLTKDFQAVPAKYRTPVPEHIKDYVPLNQFAA